MGPGNPAGTANLRLYLRRFLKMNIPPVLLPPWRGKVGMGGQARGVYPCPVPPLHPHPRPPPSRGRESRRENLCQKSPKKKSNRLLCLRGRAHCSALRTVELGLAHTLGHKAVQYSTLNVGLSSGRLCRRSYSRVVAMLACPNHSCTLAMSALCASALVAAVARKACTQKPCTSVLMPTMAP